MGVLTEADDKLRAWLQAAAGGADVVAGPPRDAPADRSPGREAALGTYLLAIEPVPRVATDKYHPAPVVLRTLYDWVDQIRQGTVHREEVSIALLDPTSAAEVMRWNLSRAWPCEWRGAPLSTSSHDLAIETLVLAHEGISRLP